VSDILTEFGRQLADRWTGLLALPGALFLAALAAAHTLGWASPFDYQHLSMRVAGWAQSAQVHSATSLVVVLLALTAVSAAAGLAALAVSAAVEYLWLASRWPWPQPLRAAAEVRTAHLQKRWDNAREVVLREADALRYDRPVQPSAARAAVQAASRISPERPERPTWIANRISSVAVRLHREYDLDLAVIWPSLWVTMPDNIRQEITSARQSLTGSTQLASWGFLYLAVGAMSWPGFVIAVVTTAIAWHRARSAADAYACLIDAAARLYAGQLIPILGLSVPQVLTRDTGRQITSILRGQSALLPAAGDQLT
jgi:hypothetical protein